MVIPYAGLNDWTGQDTPRTLEEYQRHFPDAWVAVMAVFRHPETTVKLEDFEFDRLAAPHSEKEHVRHAVVFRPKITERGGRPITELRLNVFYKQWDKLVDGPDGTIYRGRDEWWVEPAYANTPYGIYSER
jgi:hypothetical protein